MLSHLHAFRAIQWMNWVDILLASLPIYFAFRALQKATHRRVVVFFIFLLASFLAARASRWELTSLFLEFFGAIGIIGVFLVFQEDIRKTLESMLYFSLFRIRRQDHDQTWVVQEVCEAVGEMALKKVGALIVFEGKIPLLHVTKGGFTLDGELSHPLISSIFDHHSAGHDGAMIIRGKRVSRFGVHLPLSKRGSTATEKRGTRHSAALGLSEVSDALVIVVSEETGAISYARDGVLQITNVGNLKAIIKDYFGVRSLFTPSLSRLTWKRLFQNISIKMASVSLSVLMWVIFIAPSGSVQRTFELPITLKNVPASLIVDEPQPNRCSVTLMGSDAAFERWREGNRFLTLDLRDIAPGNRAIGLTPDNLGLPEGLQVKRFEPTVVTTVSHRAKTVTVPIVVSLVGRRPQSMKVKFRTEPESVPVLIRDDDSGPSLVTTEPLEFSRLLKAKSVKVKLIPPAKSQFSPATPDSVKVSVEGLLNP